MTNARAAFSAYVGRIMAWAKQAALEAVRAASDTPAFGEPDVTIDAEGIAEIRLYAFIESHFLVEGWGIPGSIAVSDIGFARVLDKIKAARPKGVRLRINSGGGDVFAGVAIANLVRQAKIPVVVDGVAASIASVIAASSPHVTMLPGTTLMLHNPWGCVCGNSRALRAEADVMDQLRDAMVDIYAGKTGTDNGLIKEALDGPDGADGTWYGAQEAVDVGLADVYEQPTKPDKEKAKALLEQRQMVAELHSVALPKNLAELPDPVDPQKPELPAPVAEQVAIAASERVCHRPGAFRIPSPK